MSFYLMHRGWMDGELFAGQRREPFDRRSAWVWLIEHAAFDGDGRGQLSHSVRYLAKAWGWSSTKVFRFIAVCVSLKMIECSSETGQLSIRLCKYDIFQSIGQVAGTPQPVTVKQTRNTSGTDIKEGTRKEEEDSEAIASGAGAPQTDPVKELWDRGKAALGQSSASLIGKARREQGDLAVMRAIVACEAERPSQPVEFFLGCLRQHGGKHGRLSPAAGIYAGFADALGDSSPDSELDRSVIVPLLGNGRA